MLDIIGAIIDGIRSADSSLKESVSSESFKKPRFPVNWDLIKLNLTPEQMMECFNVTALSSGNVKLADLLDYVNIERLKDFFSEPQLRDMIDLDFFEKKQFEKKERQEKARVKSAAKKFEQAPGSRQALLSRSKKLESSPARKFEEADRIRAKVPDAPIKAPEEGIFEFSKNPVINGIIWREILDVPVSRRVYGRR